MFFYPALLQQPLSEYRIGSTWPDVRQAKGQRENAGLFLSHRTNGKEHINNHAEIRRCMIISLTLQQMEKMRDIDMRAVDINSFQNGIIWV
jgi:hypothetical protein